MAESTPLRFPVFIVGMPRSGTTLLSSMLDAHSQIAITPETHFYTRCRSENPAEDAVPTVWRRLRQQPGMQDMALTEAEIGRIRDRLDQEEHPGPPDLLRAVCATYAERSGAEAWGEKTPDHLAHVPTILREFPEALVLGIVRDPRDVCRSLRDMPWSRDSLPESAWKWRTYARASERYRREYPDRFREVRYEDVLDDPARVLREVLAWIGAPFEEQVLAFYQRGKGPADTDREPWKAGTRRPVDPTNKEKWRDQMRPGARILVEAIAGAQMGTKGYDRGGGRIGVRGLGEVGAELGRAVGTVVQRWWRRWRMPERQAGDHTPRWIREQTVFAEED